MKKIHLKKSLFLAAACSNLFSFQLKADDCSQETIREGYFEAENGSTLRFKRPANYENSVIIDPIEKEPVVSYPNSFESSFYEQMTR